ncbi:hypothetical protein, partial [Hallella mizrahii]|uniref:hypothetical protein n=1 Tax=Hallella mizrahii TaxID=2606637 RepID=UPI0019809AAA
LIVYVSMIYLHYKDTKTFGHSFSFLLIFKTLRASYLQVGNFSRFKKFLMQSYYTIAPFPNPGLLLQLKSVNSGA